MRLTQAAAAVVVIVAAARSAAAENCVDKDVWRRQGHGHPCGDVGTSMGRGELWTAPGLVDVRVSVLRMGFYGNDDARRGTVVDLATWEGISDGADGIELPRDAGDRSAAHVASLRRQIDRDGWGAYVGADAYTRWFGHHRVATPRFGVRVGRFDRAAAVVEARVPGAYLAAIGDGPQRSFARDVDIGARTTYVLARRLRLESRARYRDLRATDGSALRDVFLSAGIEGEVSPPGPGRPTGPNTWRVLTLYAGVGLRRALVDVIPTEDMSSDMPGALDRPSSAPAAPWQLMFTLDLDFAINSQLTIW